MEKMKKSLILLIVFELSLVLVLVGGVIQYYDSTMQEKTIHNGCNCFVTPDFAKMERDAHNAVQSETIEDWLQNLNESERCYYKPVLMNALNVEFLGCTSKYTPCSYEHIKYIESWREKLKTIDDDTNKNPY